MASDKNQRSRLKKELVIWLATVGKDTRPHVVPVWFWWDGESFLIYSVPGQKVRDIQANPNVALNFNTDPEGSQVFRLTGTAAVANDAPPANKLPAYMRKYREQIKEFEWTPQSFAAQYHVPIRVRPVRFY